MNIEKVIREENLELYANLAAGIFFSINEVTVKINEKAMNGWRLDVMRPRRFRTA